MRGEPVVIKILRPEEVDGELIERALRAVMGEVEWVELELE